MMRLSLSQWGENLGVELLFDCTIVQWVEMMKILNLLLAKKSDFTDVELQLVTLMCSYLHNV